MDDTYKDDSTPFESAPGDDLELFRATNKSRDRGEKQGTELWIWKYLTIKVLLSPKPWSVGPESSYATFSSLAKPALKL